MTSTIQGIVNAKPYRFCLPSPDLLPGLQIATPSQQSHGCVDGWSFKCNVAKSHHWFAPSSYAQAFFNPDLESFIFSVNIVFNLLSCLRQKTRSYPWFRSFPNPLTQLNPLPRCVSATQMYILIPATSVPSCHVHPTLPATSVPSAPPQSIRSQPDSSISHLSGINSDPICLCGRKNVKHVMSLLKNCLPYPMIHMIRSINSTLGGQYLMATGPT